MQSPSQSIEVGDIFVHYKFFLGSDSPCTYKVTGIAGNASGDNYSDKWVVYEPFEKNDHLTYNKITCYIRPLKEFLETVEIDGNVFPRFTKSGNKVAIQESFE